MTHFDLYQYYLLLSFPVIFPLTMFIIDTMCMSIDIKSFHIIGTEY